jgi:hypothetical protein
VSFATALLTYQGGRNRAKAAAEQQQWENQYSENQLGLQRQQQAEQKRFDDASLRGQGIDPSTDQPFPYTMPPLPIPKKGQAPDPEQMVSAYVQAAVDASNAGRPDLAKQYDQAAQQYGLGAERAAMGGYYGARGTETLQGKLLLDKAQARYYTERIPAELKKAQMELQGRMAVADINAKSRMAAAKIHAQQRLASSKMSLQERELIATMAALNGASTKSSQDAFNEAMRQYSAAQQTWNTQLKTYLGGTAVPGFDPNTPPQPETFMQDVQPSAPVVNNVFYTMPNGQQIPIPVVKNKAPTQPAFDVQQLMKDVEKVQEARLQGANDQQITKAMQNAGWNAQRIQQALRQALPMQGGGF